MKIIKLLLATLLATVLGASLPALADGHNEVRDVVMRYANLEGDLDRQAELIRADRVMITGVRQSDQARNLEIQKATRRANNQVGGGEARWLTDIDGLEIRVYGDVAVASMMRRFYIYPPDAAPITPPPHWLSLVLVKERGRWGIAHSHLSPLWQQPN